MNDEILRELRKQTMWLRFLALPSLTQFLEENLKTEEHRMVYEMSNGNNSTREIAEKLKDEGLKVSHRTVSNCWRRWYALGLVVPSEKYSGRFEKIVDLSDLSID